MLFIFNCHNNAKRTYISLSNLYFHVSDMSHNSCTVDVWQRSLIGSKRSRCLMLFLFTSRGRLWLVMTNSVVLCAETMYPPHPLHHCNHSWLTAQLEQGGMERERGRKSRWEVDGMQAEEERLDIKGEQAKKTQSQQSSGTTLVFICRCLQVLQNCDTWSANRNPQFLSYMREFVFTSCSKFRLKTAQVVSGNLR